MSDRIIRNGYVVFEDHIEKADILVRGEKIAAFFALGEQACDTAELDASGLYVMPGAIDPHVHYGLHNDVGEDFLKDTPVQAVGGLTSLVCFHRGKQNYLESVPEWIKKGEQNSLIDFAYTLAFVKRQDLKNLERLVKEFGITTYKFFFDKQDIADLFYHLDDPEDKLILDRADLYFCIKRMMEIHPGLQMSVHCEDRDLFKALETYVQNSDLDQYKLETFHATRPDFVESVALASAMIINGVLGANLYAVHISSEKSIQTYEGLRGIGGNVILETCPHYLILDEHTPFGLDAKVNPPIRTKRDNEALWEAIRRGSIKTIGTDNAMSYRAERYREGKDFMSALTGFGSNGLMLPILVSEGYLKRKIPLTTISQVLSVNTARAFHLEGKGEMRVGYDADFAIVDMNLERTVGPEMYGNCDYSIYEGMTFRGWPKYTMLRGEIIAENGKAAEKSGNGKYIFRTLQ